MDTKSLTSKTKQVFMLEKMPYTYGYKHERGVSLYRYNPDNSTFEFHDFYGRVRDVLRGIQRILI